MASLLLLKIIKSYVNELLDLIMYWLIRYFSLYGYFKGKKKNNEILVSTKKSNNATSYGVKLIVIVLIK